MTENKYYTEDELVGKFQSGEFTWIDYVNHHSPEWQEEYTQFIKEHNLTSGEESAKMFVEYRGDLLETSMED